MHAITHSLVGVYTSQFICTELGGIAIAPHPKMAVRELKPGCIMKPSFGVIPYLIDEDVICSYLILSSIDSWFL